MSDAVYECHLVGMELRNFEESAKRKIEHVAFVDGKEQWAVRKSDLGRFLDLLNQGLIDHLFVGKGYCDRMEAFAVPNAEEEPAALGNWYARHTIQL